MNWKEFKKHGREGKGKEEPIGNEILTENKRLQLGQMGVRRVSSVPHLLQWKVSSIKKIELSVSIKDGHGVNINCSWPALQPPLLLKPILTFLGSV